MKKLTPAKIKYFIKDERKASKEYRHLGLPSLARDEAKHKRFFEKMLKARQGK